ncbi:MAG: YebC/PmpR family DNA-binding transcriptional regulator [Deltaproteobacteria bacterium]|nr:YebC/PmpR family DNA-binding transcriptional regulator [Deltaproteobacteria bacterium]
MAGHSKWANIQHRKSRVDAKRGKIFTRLAKEITVAARLGGGDPTGNPRLRQAVQEARANNMPNDNIERAVLKGTGELEGVSYEECLYEGYGPGGTALMVEAVTDNRNRTVAEIRHLFSRHGGNMGENGCVSWMFERRGFLAVDPETIEEEDFINLALELGADDLETEGGSFILFTAPENYHGIVEGLSERNLEISSKSLAMIPSNTVELDDDTKAKLQRLIEALEDHDDVQDVWANLAES